MIITHNIVFWQIYTTLNIIHRTDLFRDLLDMRIKMRYNIMCIFVPGQSSGETEQQGATKWDLH